MPSRILSAPFVIGLLYCLYQAWENDESYAMYIVPQVLALAVIYILQPQIDWWWYKKRPPELDPPLARMLERFVSFYHHLNLHQKRRFRQRVVLFVMAQDFIAKGFEDVPEDVKYVIAANAVQLTFGQEEFLFPKFEHLVVYPVPFPSPQFPDRRHASELQEEDGVLMFSAEQLMAGTFQPKRHFNIVLYEYARAFQLSYPSKAYPSYDEFIWEKLEAISGLKEAYIRAYIGLEEIDVSAIAVALFFTRPEQFKAVLPQAYGILSQIFNLDPCMREFPVVQQKGLSDFQLS
ncbi:MAG: zinc-dependent peptidase [Bacteroidota bacterium]